MADEYAPERARIVEVMFPSGRGCLIQFLEGAGQSHISIYRADAGITVNGQPLEEQSP